jgi:hypothetical protein
MAACPRALSSAQTFIMKFVFPVFWISLFGVATMATWFVPPHRGTPPTAATQWMMLVVWLTGSTFIVKVCGTLKRVRIDADYLYLSNYLSEIRVPLKSVETVTEIRWINIHPVTVRFRSLTEFGSSITFMPKARLFGWSSHPVVDELRRAAGLPTDGIESRGAVRARR